MRHISLISLLKSKCLLGYLREFSDLLCSAFVPAAPNPVAWADFLRQKKNPQTAISIDLMNRELLTPALFAVSDGSDLASTSYVSSNASSAVSSRAPSPPASGE